MFSTHLITCSAFLSAADMVDKFSVWSVYLQLALFRDNSHHCRQFENHGCLRHAYCALMSLARYPANMSIVDVVATFVEQERRDCNGPLVVALQGPQGCGVSWLTRQVIYSQACRKASFRTRTACRHLLA